MSMETQQQELATAATTSPTNSSSSVDNDYSHAIVKGKRTKRRRLRHYLPLPMPAAATPSTSSSAEASDGIDEEEEDMANCLILLAQGRFPEAAGPKPEALLQGEGVGGGWGDGGGGGRGERYTSRRLAEAATMSNGKASFYVYECKTCNKCFPSFQALGGHRSSHKKLKMATMAAAQEKKPREELSLQIGISTSYPNSNPLPNNTTTTTTTNPPAHHHHNSHNNNNNASSNKPKVHECSICGAEFSSGQALGGHMRRHRAEPAMPPGTEEAKQKSDAVLPLDLNLPAPADDDRGDLPGSPSFAFPRKRPVVFSPSALVGCHY